jgi:hypothetical protein
VASIDNPGALGSTSVPDYPSPRGEALIGLGVAGLVACVATVPLWTNSFFYFADDFQTFFMPTFAEIARQLKSSSFPFSTPRSWYGGAILAEYQFAVFNPVSLVLYLIIDNVRRLEQAAAIYAVFHIALLSGGLFTLCRTLRIARPEAATAAIAGSTSMWVIYWGAQTWICALVGIAWLPWAFAALVWAYRDSRFVALGALATTLALISGWPFTIVALGIAVAIGTGADFALRHRVRPCARVCFAMVVGACLAAPALFPLWFYLEESTRLRGSLTGELSAGFDTLLAAGVPVFPETWRIFGGTERLTYSPPMQYATWFLPAVLVNANWTALTRDKAPTAVILILLVAAFGALSTFATGWHFRMPFRLLPYYHISLTVLAAWLITHGRTTLSSGQIWRVGRTWMALAIPFGLAMANAGGPNSEQAVWIAALCLTALLCRWAQLALPRYWLVVPVVSHAAIFVVLTTSIPENGMVAHWRVMPTKPVEAAKPADAVRQLTLFQPIGKDGSFGLGRKLDAAFWTEIGPGNTAMYQGVESVNGYSAVQPRGFKDTLCFDYMGASCPNIAERLFRKEPSTGHAVIDLLRIERVVAQKGRLAASFAAQAGPAWTRTETRSFSEVFVRAAPLSGPRRLSVVPPGATLIPVARPAGRETYLIKAGQSGGTLVLAQPWYPGLRAYLDGQALSVRPLLNLLPSIELPPGRQGQLVIAYRPAGLDLGISVAALGLALLFFAYLAAGSPSVARWRLAGRRSPVFAEVRVQRRGGAPDGFDARRGP